MKIKYLKLKNFVNIYSGMKKKEIEIDFTKSKNKIVVLVGPNGSGKTSILSELHPFANSGNMDVRNDVNLIMDGCDGYKEIHIADGSDEYIIKHNYLFSGKSKSVKSFISKNGNELNANGNVRSFKEMVLEHLGLDQDLLKLMRLGSNVTSLVNMKSTSRKSFATKLFSDIDVYGGFYKKVAEEYRNIRSMMKNLSGKIAKYNVVDESEFEKQLSIVMRELSEYEKKKDDISKETVIIETKLKDIDINDELTVEERFDYIQNKINDAENLLDLVKDINMSKSEYELLKEKEKSSISNKITENRLRIEKCISEKDIYFEQKDEYEEKLKNAVTSTRLENLRTNIRHYEQEIQVLEKELKNRTNYDKYQLLRFKEHVEKTLSMFKELNIYDEIHLKKIIKALLNEQNVKEVIDSSTSKMREEYNKINAEIINIENLDIDLEGYVIPENTCSKNCPFKDFYYKIIGRRNNLGKLIEDRNKINKELSSCEDLYNLYNAVNEIKRHIDDFTCSVNLPLDYNSNDILLNKLNGVAIININLLNLAIDDSESFERLSVLKNDLFTCQNEFNIIKDSVIDTFDLENKILNITDKINSKNKEIEAYQNEIKTLESKLTIIESEMIDILNALEFKESFNDIQNEYNDLRLRRKEISEKKELMSTYSNIISNNKKNMRDIISYMDTLTTKKEQLSFNLKDYKNILQEYDALNLLFEDIDDIKDALDTSKGIPLLYLNVYLKNCPIMMNTLLDTIFDGRLQIDDFLIDENEFRIPFRLDGVKVPDIVYASQGESSFISIVLSLSLIIQSMTEYDIICLDELDGPLDSRNRAEFIKVLYTFIQQVGCEQVFLISHNNMFDNEPVDLLMTADVDVENYKFGNIIFKG